MSEFKVLHVTSYSKSGEKNGNAGRLTTEDEFVADRTSRLKLIGTLDGKEAQILFTRAKEAPGVFRALTKMIGKVGTLKGEFSALRKKEIIRGEVREYEPPRTDLTLADENGEKAFDFVAAPTQKWAEAYGSLDTEYINYGETVYEREKKEERPTSSI